MYVRSSLTQPLTRERASSLAYSLSHSLTESIDLLIMPDKPTKRYFLKERITQNLINHLADDAHCLQQHSHCLQQNSPCLQQAQCDSLYTAGCSPTSPFSRVHALQRKYKKVITNLAETRLVKDGEN